MRRSVPFPLWVPLSAEGMLPLSAEEMLPLSAEGMLPLSAEGMLPHCQLTQLRYTKQLQKSPKSGHTVHSQHPFKPLRTFASAKFAVPFYEICCSLRWVIRRVILKLLLPALVYSPHRCFSPDLLLHRRIHWTNSAVILPAVILLFAPSGREKAPKKKNPPINSLAHLRMRVFFPWYQHCVTTHRMLVFFFLLTEEK